MRLVIRGGTVVDPAQGKERVGDVLVEEGRIAGVTDRAPSDWEDAEVIEAEGRLVLPGLICLRTHVCEPGYEWREDVASASMAAAAGGFTTVCATPDTKPINDVRAVTEQIVTRNAASGGAKVLPVGAATMGLTGEHLSEMGDLRDAGCVAVSTGETALADGRLMRRVLEYARSVALPVFTAPLDPAMTRGTAIHEGEVSVRLGIEAMPAEAESTALFRDGMLARLAGWKVHAQRVSTAQAVAVLRRLKEDGIQITADTTPHHLWFDEHAVTDFDTSTRVNPPLRSRADVEAVRQAVAEGLIDCIATDHAPQSSIEKTVEYEWCQPGTVGLETALAVVLELVRRGVFTRMQALERLTAGPARILGRKDIGRIGEGAVADLCVVEAETPVLVQAARMSTRSRNSIFEGASLLGRVEATVIAGRVVVGS